MQFKRLARTVLAIAAGVVFAAALATPASAHHPEGPPQDFYAEHNDTCTFTETAGQLAWAATHQPEAPVVGVWGRAHSANRGGCTYLVPVIAYIEFTAYDVDGTSDDADWSRAAHVVDREVVPLTEGTTEKFELRLTPDAWVGLYPPQIDVVTVRACLTLWVWPPEEQTYDGDCGKADIHRP